MANAKSQTPLSIDPTVQTLFGNIIKGVRVTPDDARYWNSHLKELHQSINFLLHTPTRKVIKWNTWLTLRNGYASHAYVVRELQEKGFFISDVCEEFMERFLVEQPYSSLNLALMSPSDIGITEHILIEDFFSLAFLEGLKFCPPAVVPMICQSVSDCEFCASVGMEPVQIDRTDRVVYRIQYEKNIKALGLESALPCRKLHPSNMWIFAI